MFQFKRRHLSGVMTHLFNTSLIVVFDRFNIKINSECLFLKSILIKLSNLSGFTPNQSTTLLFLFTFHFNSKNISKEQKQIPHLKQNDHQNKLIDYSPVLSSSFSFFRMIKEIMIGDFFVNHFYSVYSFVC